jgi:hypothetical protein
VIPQTRIFLLLLFVSLFLIRPLFTALLWLDPYRRLALSEPEIRRSQWISAITLSFIPGAIAALMRNQGGWVLILPSTLAIAYWVIRLKSPASSWEQRLKLGILSLVGIGVLLLSVSTILANTSLQTALPLLGGSLIIITLFGFILFVVCASIYKLAIALLKFLTRNRQV